MFEGLSAWWSGLWADGGYVDTRLTALEAAQAELEARRQETLDYFATEPGIISKAGNLFESGTGAVATFAGEVGTGIKTVYTFRWPIILIGLYGLYLYKKR